MHEVSLMQSALELAEEQARLRGAGRIHRITLRIGKLAGVEPEALAFAFDVVTAGTMADGATLGVESVPVVCFCAACQAEFAPEDFIFACPRCGAPSGDVRAGRELELVSLEVSDDGHRAESRTASHQRDEEPARQERRGGST
jgi:hydrogenase nickel incorporation protein HypA/HybF